MVLTLYVDGGARGNPGPAAAGVVLLDGQHTPLLEAGYLLSEMTNNQAEYAALTLGLEAALRCAAEDLVVYSDSELVVKQVLGEYRVTSPDLKPLYEDVQSLLRKLQSWELNHVKRAGNARADQLVNLALDFDEDVIQTDLHNASPRLTPKSEDLATDREDQEAASEPRVLRVKVVRAPSKKACPAMCRLGAEYLFGATIPPNMCVDAAAVVSQVIVEMRGRDAGGSPTRVNCAREGCQACFEIMSE